jgi:hypothetical protein
MGPARLKSAPKGMLHVYEKIVGLTDDVCDRHLDSEYRDLARAMTGALCRKRPSPLTSGQPRTWACGIVYVLGRINFLSDRSLYRAKSPLILARVSPASRRSKPYPWRYWPFDERTMRRATTPDHPTRRRWRAPIFIQPAAARETGLAGCAGEYGFPDPRALAARARLRIPAPDGGPRGLAWRARRETTCSDSPA